MKNISLKLVALIFLCVNTQVRADNLSYTIKSGYCEAQGSGQAIVEITDGQAPYTFEWSDPSLEGSEVFDLMPGNYSLTVTDADACSVTQSFTIPTNSTIEVNYYGINPLCHGEASGSLVILNDYSPADLLFSIDGTNFIATGAFTSLSGGEYTLYIQESNGCISERYYTLQEPFELNASLGPDLTLNLGDQVRIDLLVNTFNSIRSVTWDPPVDPMLNFCPDFCLDPIYSFFDTTTVSVFIEDENGCTASDQVIINIDANRDVFIPNVFTPNRDGINDRFSVYGGRTVLLIKELTVRDNFGSIVHSVFNIAANDESVGWDGDFKGRGALNNVYLYKVTVEYIDGVIEDKFGTVTLVR